MTDTIRKNKHIITKIAIGLVFLVLFIWIQRQYNHLTPEMIQQWVLSYGWYAPFIFLLLALVRPLVFFPITVYYLASGLAFGALWGGVIAALGAIISAAVAYIVAKKTGTRFLTETWAGRIHTIKTRIENSGFRNMLLLRFIPLLSYDLVSYAGGLARLEMKTFLVATFLGTAPRIFGYAFVGSRALEVNSYEFWFAIAALMVVLFVPLLVYNKYHKKRR